MATPKGLTWGVLAIAAFPFAIGAAGIALNGWVGAFSESLLDKIGDLDDRFAGLEARIEAVDSAQATLTRTLIQNVGDLHVLITGLQGEIRSQGNDISDIDGMLGDHETRLRSLETWQRNVLARPTPVSPPG